VATGEMEAEHPGPFTSVVRSLDASGVIPQPFEEIYNAPTGILQPPEVSISHDNDWILGTRSDCWVPNDYRIFTSLSFSGSKVCFGYKDGRVIILDMTVLL
jgi:hypothetical protein